MCLEKLSMFSKIILSCERRMDGEGVNKDSAQGRCYSSLDAIHLNVEEKEKDTLVTFPDGAF